MQKIGEILDGEGERSDQGKLIEGQKYSSKVGELDHKPVICEALSLTPSTTWPS